MLNNYKKKIKLNYLNEKVHKKITIQNNKTDNF